MAAIDLIQLTDFNLYFPKVVGQNALISALITQASALANRYTGRILAAATYTEYMDMPPLDIASPAFNKVIPKQFPINSITSLNYDPTGAFTGGQSALTYLNDAHTITLTSFNPAWQAPLGAYYMGYGNMNNTQVLQLVYNAGYATTPPDLTMAIIIMVSYMFQRIQNNSFGVKGQFNISGELAATFELSIPQAAKDILNTYRSQRF